MKKFISFFAALLIPACLFAVDGQVLINQSSVIAAGGFPYVISLPGSYKLSGNLSVPSNSNAILIKVSNVTLDLNGFSITTPIQPQVPASIGIQATSSVTGVTIRNGVVRGFTVPLSFSVTTSLLSLEDLVLEWGFAGGSSGFDLGIFGRAVRVTGTDQSLSYGCPSVIQQSSLRSIERDFSVPGSGTCSLANNATSF